MKYCDLHIHSNGSDGNWTPEEIITEAKRLSLTVALTDHNTVIKLPEFLAEAERQGVNAVGGIEITTEYGEYEFHLLGLFIDPEQYEFLERLMKEYHVLKEISNMEMVERLNDAGYVIDYINVKKRQPNGNANRKHIAEELVANNSNVQSIAEAFATILKEGNGFYVPARRMQFIEAIKLLRSINAVPVLAHPLLDVDAENLRKLLPEAVEAGLIGMETMHSAYDDDMLKTADKISDEFGLLKSGGSDFHGPAKKDVFMGVGKGNIAVPIDFYEKLLAAKNNI